MVQGLFSVVLQVGESGLEVGLEGKGVGEMLEEIRAVVLDVGEGFLEV